MTTMVSKFGNDDEKGTILGVFRSLGALARALGPVFGSIGECYFSTNRKLILIEKKIPFQPSGLLDQGSPTF